MANDTRQHALPVPRFHSRRHSDTSGHAKAGQQANTELLQAKEYSHVTRSLTSHLEKARSFFLFFCSSALALPLSLLASVGTMEGVLMDSCLRQVPLVFLLVRHWSVFLLINRDCSLGLLAERYCAKIGSLPVIVGV